MNTTLLHTLPFSTRLTHCIANALGIDPYGHGHPKGSQDPKYREEVLQTKTVEDLFTFGLRNLVKVRNFGRLCAKELHKVLGNAGIPNRADLIYASEHTWRVAHEKDSPVGQLPFEIAALVLAEADKASSEDAAMRLSYLRGVIAGLFHGGRINEETKQQLLQHIKQH